jgi:hypothetical protein
MTHVLLCAGPTLLVIDKDGSLFYRRPGQPDVKIPYSRQNYGAFFHSARYKYDLSQVIGPDGEQNPLLPEETAMPELRPDRLSTGETVYRLVAKVSSLVGKGGHVQESSRNVPTTPAKEVLASHGTR